MLFRSLICWFYQWLRVVLKSQLSLWVCLFLPLATSASHVVWTFFIGHKYKYDSCVFLQSFVYYYTMSISDNVLTVGIHHMRCLCNHSCLLRLFVYHVFYCHLLSTCTYFYIWSSSLWRDYIWYCSLICINFFHWEINIY